MTIKVQFHLESGNQVVDASGEKGEKLNQIAHRHGVVIQQSCGGVPSCTDCKIIVLKNFDQSFYPMEGPEKRLLGNVYHITHERLACQALVNDDTSVLVPNAKNMKTSKGKGVSHGYKKEKNNFKKIHNKKS